jgi:prepilin-type N-terminal cleavage/methylation domain-containing protein
MNNRTQQRRANDVRRGFTLIEVALAVLVVAIGIMAALVLVNSGLDSSRRAVADTRAATFADDVFNALRTQNYLALDSGGASWESFWKRFVARQTNVAAAAAPMWQHRGVNLGMTRYYYPSLFVSNGFYRISFTNYDRWTLKAMVPSHTFRYRLAAALRTVTNQPPWGGPPAGWRRIWTNRVEAVLTVWEGAFGNTNLNNALTFSTEFMNTGGL